MSTRVVIYLTRPGAGAGSELLVAKGGTGLPETILGAGEHPCEAADRVVQALLAPYPGAAAETFAYRKVSSAPHAFLTEAPQGLPDEIGPFRWVPLADSLPWDDP